MTRMTKEQDLEAQLSKGFRNWWPTKERPREPRCGLCALNWFVGGHVCPPGVSSDQ